MSNFFKSETIRALAAAEDQGALIEELLGDALDHIEMTGNDIIMAVYIEKELRGSVILPDQTLKESLYQGKVGRVLKIGPDAFRFKNSYPWVSPLVHEINSDGSFTTEYYSRAAKHTPKVGDWVIFKPTDNMLFGLRGIPCRYSLDSTVKMITTKPEYIL